MTPPSLIQIGTIEGVCNLKCPQCPIHSPEYGVISPDAKKEILSLDNFIKILDEVKDFKPTIKPISGSEFFLLPDWDKYLQAIKDRGMTVQLFTNGLLIDKAAAEKIVEIGVDTVVVSIDGTTPETLKLTRGITNLEDLHQAVFRLLDARKDRLFPRIGVTFVLQDCNRHQREDFLNFWIQHVDFVKFGERRDYRKTTIELKAKRFKCKMFENLAAIDAKGNLTHCFQDYGNEHIIGNVLEEGFLKLWNGAKRKKYIELQQKGEYNKIPLCNSCDFWEDGERTSYEENNMLVVKSEIDTFYNRKDRLESMNILRQSYKEKNG